MRCPHNLKLRWKSEWKIQFLFYSLQGKLTACWAGISASLSAPPDSFTLAPQDRGRGLCRNSTLGCIFSCPLWPCSSSSTFYLSNLAFVSLLHTFPAEAGMVPCLSKNVLFFVLVNKQKNSPCPMVVWVFCFGLGGFCVCIRRETKEGNTKFELKAYINYVSESTPDTSQYIKTTKVIWETLRSLNRQVFLLRFSNISPCKGHFLVVYNFAKFYFHLWGATLFYGVN